MARWQAAAQAKTLGPRPSGRRPDVNWDGDPALSSEDKHAGWDQQVMAAALDEADCAGRYAMALASHEPSFAPDAPVSPLDPGGPAHIGV